MLETQLTKGKLNGKTRNRLFRLSLCRYSSLKSNNFICETWTVMKFSNSKDGVKRKTFSVKVRLSEIEVSDLLKSIENHGFESTETGLRQFFRNSILDAIIKIFESESEDL